MTRTLSAGSASKSPPPATLRRHALICAYIIYSLSYPSYHILPAGTSRAGKDPEAAKASGARGQLGVRNMTNALDHYRLQAAPVLTTNGKGGQAPPQDEAPLFEIPLFDQYARPQEGFPSLPAL